MIANQQFTSSSIQINGNSFAFLPVGTSLTANNASGIRIQKNGSDTKYAILKWTQAAITISTGISNSLLFLV